MTKQIKSRASLFPRLKSPIRQHQIEAKMTRQISAHKAKKKTDHDKKLNLCAVKLLFKCYINSIN